MKLNRILLSSISLIEKSNSNITPLFMLNRNKRKPTKSNHGARPCSSYGRKSRRLAWIRKETIYAPKTKKPWKID